VQLSWIARRRAFRTNQTILRHCIRAAVLLDAVAPGAALMAARRSAQTHARGGATPHAPAQKSARIGMAPQVGYGRRANTLIPRRADGV